MLNHLNAHWDIYLKHQSTILISCTHAHFSLLLFHCHYYYSLPYSFIFVHTCGLSLKHSEIQLKLVKHGVFPIVSVQVQHGEPGNMHL